MKLIEMCYFLYPPETNEFDIDGGWLDAIVGNIREARSEFKFELNKGEKAILASGVMVNGVLACTPRFKETIVGGYGK